jgi:cytochrome b6-f complex iron-sulfur subunit
VLPVGAEPEAEVEPAAVAVQVQTEQRLIEVSPEEAGVTRRQFFNRALGVTFGTFSGLLGTSMLAFAWPRISGGFGSDVNAGQVRDLLDQAINDDGSITPVFVPEARAYVVPGPDALSAQFDGKSVEAAGVMAIWQKCVHLGCRVPWCSTSQGFECPCHGSKYNSIGEYNAGPAPRNLDRFVVEVTDGGELLIKTGTVIETPRAFQPSVSYPQGPSCIGG